MSASTVESIWSRPRRYVAEIARDRATVRATQALRYHVFAEEMGARLHTRIDGHDVDELDDYCDHLLVREVQTGRIVACTRLLSDTEAARFGRFYSEGEFDLNGVLALPGRFLEIGRTCVDPRHRGSVVLSTLWNGLAEYVYQGRFNYLMGCASISPGPHGFSVDAVYRRIEPEQRGPVELAVRSKNPVPGWMRCPQDESGIPPLLQAYLRLGCQVCGEPYWDEDFNCMDVFILLDLSKLQTRYERRFIAGKAASNYAETPGLV
ncbi:GNAT family N-acetyltransferase [Methylococcus sp. EFPC2]|uniref:GNAT family N-acetyltransferase n=1 Tax=Methylococcus sp. EFPC2 TaxID=2812648 RepID=UPI0019679E82|nr:GNAT family N-acyltransferase [Methylococcus sp. EFPC2]QSA96343.1 GNAT family N-acetyltransferase [Methylococcus sp. EFPC2]